MSVQLSPLSPEFGRIEYELQLLLDAPKLEITECHDIQNPHISAQFASFCKTMSPNNIVTLFLPLQSLPQSLNDITAKGIRVDPTQGFHFKLDSLDIDRTADNIEVIRVEVALGSVLNASSSSASDETPDPSSITLRPGYHSLCLSSKSEYVVFNSGQLRPCNLVKFAGGENLATARDSDDTCDLCQTQKATIWCVNDCAKLCPECDESSHSGNKILQRHRRVNLADARALMEFCPVHKDENVEYYCPQCQEPVCLKCKMTGTHSRGEAASHVLLPIKQAYNDAVEASSEEDPIFTRRRKIISEKMEAADAKLSEITANADAVEKEIMRIAETAVKKVREMENERALIVESVKTELTRKRNELDKISRFVNCQKQTAGPLAFLRAFDRQTALVGTMQETSDLPGELKVEGDLRVWGSLDVTSSDEPFSQAPTRQREPEPEPEVPNPPMVPPPPPDDIEEIPDSPSKADSPSSKRSSLKRKSEAGPEYTSLVALAQRREQKNHARGIELTFQPFKDSSILTTPAQCAALYLCFPFRAQPQTHLLFSTERDGRSIRKMHKMIDGVGITVVLIKKDDFIFGGFAAAKWRDDGVPVDSPNSFIFSVSQDAYIPYRPRIADACALYATETTLTFGRFDLVLDDDFDGCSGIIELSYGIGFNQGSTEAQTFLAGHPYFRADIVEVWGFFTIGPQ